MTDDSDHSDGKLDTTDSVDVAEPHIKVGHRVECYKLGPFHGKRGTVADRIGEVIVVDFPTMDSSSRLVDHIDYFEQV